MIKRRMQGTKSNNITRKNGIVAFGEICYNWNRNNAKESSSTKKVWCPKNGTSILCTLPCPPDWPRLASYLLVGMDNDDDVMTTVISSHYLYWLKWIIITLAFECRVHCIKTIIYTNFWWLFCCYHFCCAVFLSIARPFWHIFLPTITRRLFFVCWWMGWIIKSASTLVTIISNQNKEKNENH